MHPVGFYCANGHTVFRQLFYPSALLMQGLFVSTCIPPSYVLEDGPFFWHRMSLLVNWNIRSQFCCHIVTLPLSRTCCLSFYSLSLSLHSAFFSFQLFRLFFFLFPSTLLFLCVYIYISFIFPSILLFLFRYFFLILSEFPYNFPPIFPSFSLFCFIPLIPYLTQNVSCDRRRYIFWLCNMNRRILQYSTVIRYAVEFSMLLDAFAKLQKATIRFVMSVWPSIHMAQLDSHWTGFH
jgi:hypothetical protein